MRMVGWCLSCRKVRHVRVSSSMLSKRVVTGICAACEEAADKARKERNKR